jgi:hypothetical protein
MGGAVVAVHRLFEPFAIEVLLETVRRRENKALRADGETSLALRRR